MSRTTTALALIVAGSLAFAGLSALPGCSWKPPAYSAPDGQADTMAPPPLGDDGVLYKHIGVDTNKNGKIDPDEIRTEVVKPKSHSENKAEAQADFRDTVKAGSGWIIGLLGLATVGLFVASFFIPTIPRVACGVGIGLMGAMWLARYMLLAYGTLAADIVAWACLAFLGISLIGGGWTLALWWKRRILYQQGVNMAREGGTRDAVALMAAGSTVAEKARKSIASALETAKADPERMNLIKSTLRDKGIKL